MIIEDMLENYNEYLAQMKTIDHEIAKIELEEVSISGSNFAINGDIRPKGYMASNTENKVIKNVDRIKLLEKQKKELKAKVEMIDSLLNTLDDYHKEIIELRYKENKKPLQIASILYRTKRAINKELRFALDELDEKYKKVPEKFPLSSH